MKNKKGKVYPERSRRAAIPNAKKIVLKTASFSGKILIISAIHN